MSTQQPTQQTTEQNSLQAHDETGVDADDPPDTDSPTGIDVDEDSNTPSQSTKNQVRMSKIEWGQLHRLMAQISSHLTEEMDDDDLPDLSAYGEYDVHPWDMIAEKKEIKGSVTALADDIITEMCDVDGDERVVADTVDEGKERVEHTTPDGVDATTHSNESTQTTLGTVTEAEIVSAD